jgi:uncharacterized protein (TIGR02145 family)
MKQIFFLFILFITNGLFSQIEKINANTILNETNLTIKFDLSKITSKTSDIQFVIKNKKGKTIYPLEIQGDLRNVKPGKNKQIICTLNPEDKIKKKYSIDVFVFPAIDSTLIFPKNIKYGFVQSLENKIYYTVKIGKQTWLAENLRTTHFNNGEKINILEDKDLWKTSTTGLALAFNYDSINYKKQGFYYTWQVVNDKRGICPTGWHIPKDSEWKMLSKELKKENVALKLIEKNPNHWKKNEFDTTIQNITGFGALPTGLVKEDGSFQDSYTASYWWSNSLYYAEFSCYFMINPITNKSEHPTGNQNMAMPIRCIKD